MGPPLIGRGFLFWLPNILFLCVKRPSKGPERIWLLDIAWLRGRSKIAAYSRGLRKPGFVPGFFFGTSDPELECALEQTHIHFLKPPRGFSGIAISAS